VFNVPPFLAAVVAAIKFVADASQPTPPTSAKLMAWVSATAAAWLLLTSIWKISIAREEDGKAEPEILHEGLYASISTLCTMLKHYCNKRGCGDDIRATFHRVVPPLDNPTKIEQVIPYSGSATDGMGREFSINTGITGQAIRRRKPITMSSTMDRETDHRQELIDEWGYTEAQAKSLTQGRFSAAAIPVLDLTGQDVLGVIYLDSSERAIFDRADIQEIIVVGSAAVSDFVTKRY